MKNLLFLALPFICVCCMSNTITANQSASPVAMQVMHVDSHFNLVIGSASGSVYTVTFNKTTMKTQWESFIGTSAPDFDPNSFKIEITSGLYYLVGTSYDGESRSAINLELDGGSFYVANVGGNANTCTCSSNCCQLGCSPLLLPQGWYCTSCTAPSGCGNCSKTETAGGTGIFY